MIIYILVTQHILTSYIDLWYWGRDLILESVMSYPPLEKPALKLVKTYMITMSDHVHKVGVQSGTCFQLFEGEGSCYKISEKKTKHKFAYIQPSSCLCVSLFFGPFLPRWIRWICGQHPPCSELPRTTLGGMVTIVLGNSVWSFRCPEG